MAYGRGGYGNKGGNKKGKGVRVTGLFKTKRQGLYVGGINDEKLAELIALIKQAKAADKEITVFMWKSKFSDGPLFSLTMDLAQDKNERGSRPKRRPIEDDDDDNDQDEAEPAEDGDDPFGDD